MSKQIEVQPDNHLQTARLGRGVRWALVSNSNPEVAEYLNGIWSVKKSGVTTVTVRSNLDDEVGFIATVT